MNLSFKRCHIDDLDALVKVSKDTFIAAFEKDNDPEDFKHYIDTAFSQDAVKKQLQDPNSLFYFAYLKDDLIGYFKLNSGLAQTDNMDNNSIELERIYIVSSYQNKGFGKSLLLYVIDLARSKNRSFLWLGVWQKNKAAVRFYERHGFKIFGSHPYYIGKDEQTDWLMRLDLL